MATRTDTLKVAYVVDGEGKVIGSFNAVSKSAKDLERDVASAGRSMDSAAGSAGRFGKALGVGIGAAVTGIGVGLGIYIRNTIRAEEVQAQLTARIRDTGNAAGRTLEQLNAQAQAIQQATRFDDSAVGSAQAALMVFKDIEGLNFDRAVELSADLATVWGTDMATAAERLGTALANPERGLRSLASAGLEFTEAERESIKAMAESGRTAEVITVILDRLNGTVGTAAEASGNTLAGAFDKLKNAASKVLEGDSGSDGMRGVREQIESLTALLNDPQTQQGFDTLAEGILKAGAAAAQALSQIGPFTERVAESIARAQGMTAIDDVEGTQRRLDKVNAVLKQRETLGGRVAQGAGNIPMPWDLPGVGGPTAPFKYWENNRLVAMSTEELEAERQKLEGFQAWQQSNLFSSVQGSATGSWERTPPTPPTLTGGLPGGGQPPGPSGPTEADKEWAEFVKDMAALEGVWAESKRDVANAENRRRNEEDAAIERGRAVTAALISDMEFELSLIGKSNEERARAIEMRYADANATEVQREQLGSLAAELVRAQEAQYFLDSLKDSTVDLAVQAAASMDEAGEAVERYAERVKRIALQMLAEKAITWLFGMFGGGTDPVSGESRGSLTDLYSGNGFGFAKGAAFQTPSPSLHSYVNQVHSTPKLFAFSSGGVFGEAGPEAIMPLERGPDGSLGVKNYGGGDAVPNVNIRIVGGPSEGASASARMGPDGLEVEVLYRGAERYMAGGIGDGSSPIVKQLKARFGLKEQV